MLTSLFFSALLSVVEPTPIAHRGSGRKDPDPIAATFNPEPNEPPTRTGGSGTRIAQGQTIAPSRDKCPEGTSSAVPTDDGTGSVICYPELPDTSKPGNS